MLALAEAVASVDGAYPLGEHVVLHLRHGDEAARHLLAEEAHTRQLLGYAHLDTSDRAEGPAAELAVGPDARRRGLGGLLLDELVRIADTQPGRMRLWAHGADTAAAHLAGARGFHRIRRLYQLRRSLYAPLPPAELPPDVRLRPFDADRDVAEWLDLNARAFANLPDQAGWTEADLRRRMAEPWFDAAGFLLAEGADGRLVGFHWTKVHGHADSAHEHPPREHPGIERPHVDSHRHAHDPIGEVYVVGVDPGQRGRGLGRALTLAGLHHLRRTGLSTAMLYVDADNTAAISLYQSLGFATWDVDTLFRR